MITYMIILILLIILLIILFIFLNNLLNKSIIEKYTSTYTYNGNTLLCGNTGDICRVDEEDISTCCKNYDCVRQDGNFNHKICVNKNRNDNINTKALTIPKRLIPNIDFPYTKPIKVNEEDFIEIDNIGQSLLNIKGDLFEKNFCKK